jgi:hypothetical protein
MRDSHESSYVGSGLLLFVLTGFELLAGRAAGLSGNRLLAVVTLLVIVKVAAVAIGFMRLRNEPRLIAAIALLPLLMAVAYVAGLVFFETWGAA